MAETHMPWDGGDGDVITEARLGTLARGWLGYAQATAPQAAITSEADLTGLSVTVTVAADRLIKVTGAGIVSRTVADGVAIGDIQQDGVTVGRWCQHAPSAATEYGNESGFVILDGLAADDYVFNLALERFSGTGSVSTNAATTAPGYILVEDLGPASA